MAGRFPDATVWKTPAGRLIIKAIIAARTEADEDPQTAVELLGEIGVPASIAVDLARLVRRVIGKSRMQEVELDPDMAETSGSAKIRTVAGAGGVYRQAEYLGAEELYLPMNFSAVAKHLGISRPTLYSWTKAPRTRRSRQAGD